MDLFWNGFGPRNSNGRGRTDRRPKRIGPPPIGGRGGGEGRWAERPMVRPSPASRATRSTRTRRTEKGGSSARGAYVAATEAGGKRESAGWRSRGAYVAATEVGRERRRGGRVRSSAGSGWSLRRGGGRRAGVADGVGRHRREEGRERMRALGSGRREGARRRLAMARGGGGTTAEEKRAEERAAATAAPGDGLRPTIGLKHGRSGGRRRGKEGLPRRERVRRGGVDGVGRCGTAPAEGGEEDGARSSFGRPRLQRRATWAAAAVGRRGGVTS